MPLVVVTWLRPCIEGLCKRRDFAKALQLHSQMNEMDIHPDLNLLQTLVSYLADEKEMICLLNEAKIHFNKKSMTTIFNVAFSCLVKNGLTNKAHHLLRAMMNEDDGDDTKVDETICNALPVQPPVQS